MLLRHTVEGSEKKRLHSDMSQCISLESPVRNSSSSSGAGFSDDGKAVKSGGAESTSGVKEVEVAANEVLRRATKVNDAIEEMIQMAKKSRPLRPEEQEAVDRQKLLDLLDDVRDGEGL